MRIERSEPILPAQNLAETRSFYERLGFVAWYGTGDYEIFSRGHLVVHFFAEPDLTPRENDASCYWRVEDAERFYNNLVPLNLASEGIPQLTGPGNRVWGMREFTIVDPSGNLVRVGHDLNTSREFV